MFQRGNIWVIQDALIRPNADVTLIALWNQKAGEGPGDIGDMVMLAKSHGAKVREINSNVLFGIAARRSGLGPPKEAPAAQMLAGGEQAEPNSDGPAPLKVKLAQPRDAKAREMSSNRLLAAKITTRRAGPVPSNEASAGRALRSNGEQGESDTDGRTPLKVFISYSHQDEKMRVRLGHHLTPIVDQGLIRVWHEREIEAGADWEGEINREIEETDIILLLVSASFINSRYSRRELLRAIERRSEGKSLPIPIILRFYDWTNVFTGYGAQAIPRDNHPISGGGWRNQDVAFTNVVTELRRTV